MLCLLLLNYCATRALGRKISHLNWFLKLGSRFLYLKVLNNLPSNARVSKFPMLSQLSKCDVVVVSTE